MNMKTHLIIALRLTGITLVMFGVIYPLVISGLAKFIGPDNGRGATTTQNGRVIGFKVVGQKFVSDRYFNSRPSAVGYNAAATGGSNKSNGNPDYLKEVQQRLDDFLVRNPGINKSEVPVDLITASGGGLDPDISVQACRVQVKRIANARGLKENQLMELIDNQVQGPVLGLFGPSHVNVLELNLALDAMKPSLN